MTLSNFYLIRRLPRTLLVGFIAALGSLPFISVFPPFLHPGQRFGMRTIYENMWRYFPIPLSALITVILCWWLLVERPKCFTRSRFVVVGLISGMMAHPILWILIGMLSVTENIYVPSSFEEITEGLAGLIVVTVYGWVLMGWATAAVGAVGGWLFSLVWNHHIAVDRKGVTTL